MAVVFTEIPMVFETFVDKAKIDTAISGSQNISAKSNGERIIRFVGQAVTILSYFLRFF